MRVIVDCIEPKNQMLWNCMGGYGYRYGPAMGENMREATYACNVDIVIVCFDDISVPVYGIQSLQFGNVEFLFVVKGIFWVNIFFLSSSKRPSTYYTLYI